jgi:protein involved in polysaccharide export with SLBB domain
MISGWDVLSPDGKVYSAGTLNTAPARQVDPVAFHEAVSGPDQLESYLVIPGDAVTVFVCDHRSNTRDPMSSRFLVGLG